MKLARVHLLLPGIGDSAEMLARNMYDLAEYRKRRVAFIDVVQGLIGDDGE